MNMNMIIDHIGSKSFGESPEAEVGAATEFSAASAGLVWGLDGNIESRGICSPAISSRFSHSHR